MSFNFNFQLANGASSTNQANNNKKDVISAEQYAESLGIEKESAEEMLDDMFSNGVHNATKEYAELFNITMEEAAKTLGSIYNGIDFTA